MGAAAAAVYFQERKEHPVIGIVWIGGCLAAAHTHVITSDCIHLAAPAAVSAKAFVYGKGRAAKKFPYSQTTVLSIMRQYCSGIAYMHQAGFSHNDIKPGNVLLDVDVNGQLMPVVCDFGITRASIAIH